MSSLGQFSDRSDGEEEEEVERFNPIDHPSMEVWSLLDHKSLGTGPPISGPSSGVTSDATDKDTVAMFRCVQSHLGPSQEPDSDPSGPFHPDLTRSWRDSWET